LKSPAEPSLRSGRVRSLLAAFIVLLAWAWAPTRGTAAQAPQTPGVPDAQAAADILDHFRQSIWVEPIYAEFNLREMPRRGDEHLFHGCFWGGRNEHGPATRIEISTGAAAFGHRFLVQGGPDGGIWTSDGGAAGALNPRAALQPLVAGVEMTPFDILPMPYLYWLDAGLVGVERIRGRPSYIYVFTPSADFAAQNPSVKSVRAYLDTQYDALVQSEITGPEGRISKTLSLLELRKVGDRWIPKDVDVRNEASRDKTRLSLTAVAVGIPLSQSAFDPAQLGTPLAPPPSGKVSRIPQ
jgi:hypothetical protein